MNAALVTFTVVLFLFGLPTLMAAFTLGAWWHACRIDPD
jgi:hypothetical protein